MANPWDELEDAEGQDVVVEKQPWDELEDINGQEESSAPEVSTAKAFALGAGEGLTLGADKPLAGLSAVIGQLAGAPDLSVEKNRLQDLQAKLKQSIANKALRDDKVPQVEEIKPEDYESPELLDTYYEAEKDHQKLKDAARDQHFWATLAGNIGGGLPTAGVIGKAAKSIPALTGKLGTMVKEGMIAGGTLGATTGESEILKGDIEKLPEEIGQTAIGGGIVAGAGGSLIKGVGKLANAASDQVKKSKLFDLAKMARKAGLQNEDIRSEEAFLKSRSTAKEAIGDVQKTLRGERQTTFGDTKKDVEGIDLSDLVEDFDKNVNNFPAKTPEMIKDKQIVKDKLYELYSSDLSNLTTDEASQVENSLKNLTTTFGDKASPISGVSPEFKKLISNASVGIKNRIREVSGTNEAYDKYKSLSEAMESAGLSTKGKGTYSPVKMEQEVERFKNNMLNAANPEESAIEYDKFNNFMSKLKVAMPEYHAKISPQLKQIQDKYELIRNVQAAPKIALGATPTKVATAGIIGWGKAQPIIAAHAVGHAERIAKSMTGTAMKSVVNMIPEQIQDLVKGLAGNETAKSFIQPLINAANSPDSRRAAIMYSLYQQPAFREMLKQAGEAVTPDVEE